MEFEKAVAERIRDALHRGDLFDGAIPLASPCVDLRQINGHVGAVDRILGDGQEFTAAKSLLNCLLFPIEASIDHAQQTESGGEVRLSFHCYFDFFASD